MPVKVLTNHKSLEYFMTTKKLTPRQTRWVAFLSEFNFVVTYQTGKKNDKADALTRKPNERPISNEDDRQEHRMQVLLPPERIKIQPIEIMNESNKKSVGSACNKSAKANHDKLKEESEEHKKSHAAEPHAKPEEKTNKQKKV